MKTVPNESAIINIHAPHCNWEGILCDLHILDSSGYTYDHPNIPIEHALATVAPWFQDGAEEPKELRGTLEVTFGEEIVYPAGVVSANSAYADNDYSEVDS